MLVDVARQRNDTHKAVKDVIEMHSGDNIGSCEIFCSRSPRFSLLNYFEYPDRIISIREIALMTGSRVVGIEFHSGTSTVESNRISL